MPVVQFRGLAAAFVSCAMLVAALPVGGGTAEAASATPSTTRADAPAPLVVTARGGWSPTVIYARDDLVTWRGSAWRSKHANNEGNRPGSTSPSSADDWELFAAGFNPLGPWGTNPRYEVNDLVTRLGATWRAKNTSINKPPESNAANWAKFADRGAIGQRGATGPRGPAGPSAVGNGTAAAPAFRFTSSPDTGIFSPGGGKIALVQNGKLLLHNIGADNLALGLSALGSNIGGNRNTAIGSAALISNKTGLSNTAVGSFALNQNDQGNFNTAVGDSALLKNTGSNNTAVGYWTLKSNIDGDDNTALGLWALRSNMTGDNNTAVGRSALLRNSVGAGNTALGYNALASNTQGEGNTAVGIGALSHNSIGEANTAVGQYALFYNVNGFGNIAIGQNAGSFADTPTNSIFISNSGADGDTQTIKVGSQGLQTSAFIAGIVGVTTGVADATPVLIDSAGQLGTVSSSRRYKEDIRPMGAMIDILGKLRPVSFRYIKPYADGSKLIQYGLIAEEVAEVFPYLAVFNDKGQPETVKYHLLPTFLLAGYQEQQRVIEAQAEQIASLEERIRRIEALVVQAGMTTVSN